ncbi:multidrug effflux MFS transporter [Pseudokineococcus marinus]|uniref:Multidrug effflux MFS transporter n=1 Tax=Pseudokineococcus marinus TaxID=351215 RepID=A0A849BSY2_9ACTN|nr:multidrug effflux MFS transporter [Pseudokineococcus marinus]NNH23564.1 multidrug effflux MFS transporter [Pseudokineococcus marinus]
MPARGPVARGTTSTRAPAFWVLVLLSGVSALATDMYLPALPAVGRDLGAGDVAAQLTLTAFLVGFAAGSLVLGPVSDAVGRRPLLLLGPAAFAVASVLCALAPGAGVLVVARLVQGVAASAGAVCARAVVSDTHRGADAAARFGLLTAVGLLGPVVAPTVGAGVLQVGDWRLVFGVLAGIGLLQVLGAWRGVPESLPVHERGGATAAATAARVVDLLRDRRFTRHVVVACLATVGFFSYIGGSSLVLQGVYGVGAATYGLVFAANGAAMAATSFAFARLVHRWPATALRRTGLAVAAGSSALLLVAALLAPAVGGGPPPFPLVWVLLSGLTAGMGLVLPAGFALAQAAGDRARGTASALCGGLAFTCGALVIPLTGAVGTGSVVPMAALMTLGLSLALLASRRATA